MLFMCPIYSRTDSSSCSDKDTGIEIHSGPTLKTETVAIVYDAAPLEFFANVSSVNQEIPFKEFVL